MAKIILHIDLNAFFVRCEEIMNPSLEGKPVIIGHKGRGGIVSTCSYAARKYGIHSAMPTFQATQLCPNLIIIPGNYHLYSSKSKEFFNFVKKYSPIIEKASVDECFVDMTSQLKDVNDVMKYLKDMQANLLKETGLKCSIGVAPTKFLAKMASDMKKPMGITIIRRKDVRKMLDPLPIESFYGIGKKTSPRLRELGINTIGDLAKRINSDDPVVKNEFGKFYSAIKDWINGYGSDVVDTEPFDPKSIGNSETLMHDTNSYDELKEALLNIAKEVSDRAIEANKVGSSVQIVLKDDDFKVINRSMKLSKPINDYASIANAVITLLDKNYNEEKNIRLVGVTLQNLVHKDEVVVQLSIFDNYDEIKEECATKLLIGELNRKMNKAVFKTAGDSLREKKYGIR
ncbi:MAG: DNA polymerase IV [Bacilli bacterium]|nr:DNA polymerase IV [Bacilli bacterium]